MRALTLLALLASVTAAAPVPAKKPAKPGGDLLGTWEVLSIDRGGGGGVKGPAKMLVKIEEGKWTFLRDDGTGAFRPSVEYFLRLDVTKTPAWIDLRRRAADDPPMLRGLIRADGDTARMVYALRGSGRPKELKVTGANDALFTLKRVAKP